jgi:phage head maturation protease
VNPLCQVRGYANVFNVLSAPIGDDDEPSFRAIVRPGAYGGLVNVIPCTVLHGGVQIATTWDRSLRLWTNSHGVAFEADITCTPDGRGTLAMVASGFCAMSIGLTIKKSTIFHDETGQPCHDVSRAEIDHISVVEAAAFPGACCWLSDMPADRMSPRIRNASLRWRLGKIAHEEKRARERAMLARSREMEARAFLAKAAPVRRGARGKPLMTIPPMPTAMRRAVSMGISPRMPTAMRRAGIFF